MLYGPMQMVVMSFPTLEIPVDLRDELARVRERGLVRMVDAVFVSKDDEANLVVLEGSDLEQEEVELLGTMASVLFGYGAEGEAGVEAALAAASESSARDVFGLDENDLLDIADSIPARSSALFILLEHVWAHGLREAVERSDGTVIANGWITPETLVAIGADAASVE